MLQEQIGQTAGEIWGFLNGTKKGESTFAAMQKKLEFEGSLGELALGWLAREDKIEIAKKGAGLNVKLK